MTVADVHVDAPVMEDSEIHDEPPKEILKTVYKGAKSSAKGPTKKKTQPDESDPNSFDVESKKDLAEWYRENEIFYNKKLRGHKNFHKKQRLLFDKAASMNLPTTGKYNIKSTTINSMLYKL